MDRMIYNQQQRLDHIRRIVERCLNGDHGTADLDDGEIMAIHSLAAGDHAGAWVGVGSVCKRNSNVGEIYRVFKGTHDARPDLRLHGFGLKKTSLAEQSIRQMLYSADSI